MILSLGTRIHFHDENPSMLLLYATVKIKEIIHIIFSLIVYHWYHNLPTRILEWVLIPVEISFCVVNLRYAVWR